MIKTAPSKARLTRTGLFFHFIGPSRNQGSHLSFTRHKMGSLVWTIRSGILEPAIDVCSKFFGSRHQELPWSSEQSSERHRLSTKNIQERKSVAYVPIQVQFFTRWDGPYNKWRNSYHEEDSSIKDSFSKITTLSLKFNSVLNIFSVRRPSWLTQSLGCS